jgi:DNA repair exonuclease SbcCD ATPase subunit
MLDLTKKANHLGAMITVLDKCSMKLFGHIISELYENRDYFGEDIFEEIKDYISHDFIDDHKLNRELYEAMKEGISSSEFIECATNKLDTNNMNHDDIPEVCEYFLLDLNIRNIEILDLVANIIEKNPFRQTKEFKDIYQIESLTSKLGLTYPHNTCPDIDREIDKITEAISDIEDEIKELEKESDDIDANIDAYGGEEDVRERLDEINEEITELEERKEDLERNSDKGESLRSACEKMRELSTEYTSYIKESLKAQEINGVFFYQFDKNDLDEEVENIDPPDCPCFYGNEFDFGKAEENFVKLCNFPREIFEETVGDLSELDDHIRVKSIDDLNIFMAIKLYILDKHKDHFSDLGI